MRESSVSSFNDRRLSAKEEGGKSQAFLFFFFLGPILRGGVGGTYCYLSWFSLILSLKGQRLLFSLSHTTHTTHEDNKEDIDGAARRRKKKTRKESLKMETQNVKKRGWNDFHRGFPSSSSMDRGGPRHVPEQGSGIDRRQRQRKSSVNPRCTLSDNLQPKERAACRCQLRRTTK